MNIIIVGGGLLGLLTARELARSGQSVVVLEKGRFGMESSWAGGGILSPLYPWTYPEPVNRLAQWSQQHYAQLAETLRDESGIDPQWTQSGMLILDEDRFSPARAWAATYGMPVRELDPRQLREDETELLIGPHRGLLFPEIAQIRNPRLVKSALAACQRYGVELHEQTEVTALLNNGKRVIGAETLQGRHVADKIVICAGAWSRQLLAEQKISIEIKPLRGQMIMFRAPPGLIRRITLYKEHYVIPRRDGRVLTGSTMEDVGFDKTTSEEALNDLKLFAQQLYPALKDYPVERHWAGLRPATPTGIPYITSVPDRENLYINAGHFRNGVILAPASAQLLADLVLGRETALDPLAYSLTQPH